MTDHAEFTDDISQLWGPATNPNGQPTTQPPSAAPAAAGPPRARLSSSDERLAVLEDQLRNVQKSVSFLEETVPEALRCQLEVELIRVHRDAAEAIEAGLGRIDAVLGTRLDGLAQQLTEVAEATATVAADVARVEAQSRAEVARVDAAMEAHEAEPVGKHRAWKVRHKVQADLEARLAELRTETGADLDQRLGEAGKQIEAALDQGLAEVEARLGRRLDDLAAQVEELAQRVPQRSGRGRWAALALAPSKGSTRP